MCLPCDKYANNHDGTREGIFPTLTQANVWKPRVHVPHEDATKTVASWPVYLLDNGVCREGVVRHVKRIASLIHRTPRLVYLVWAELRL